MRLLSTLSVGDSFWTKIAFVCAEERMWLFFLYFLFILFRHLRGTMHQFWRSSLWVEALSCSPGNPACLSCKTFHRSTYTNIQKKMNATRTPLQIHFVLTGFISKLFSELISFKTVMSCDGVDQEKLSGTHTCLSWYLRCLIIMFCCHAVWDKPRFVISAFQLEWSMWKQIYALKTRLRLSCVL